MFLLATLLAKLAFSQGQLPENGFPPEGSFPHEVPCPPDGVCPSGDQCTPGELCPPEGPFPHEVQCPPDGVCPSGDRCEPGGLCPSEGGPQNLECCINVMCSYDPKGSLDLSKINEGEHAAFNNQITIHGLESIITVHINGVDEIQDNAFQMFHRLEMVYFTTNIQKIGMNAFQDCHSLQLFEYMGTIAPEGTNIGIMTDFSIFKVNVPLSYQSNKFCDVTNVVKSGNINNGIDIEYHAQSFTLNFFKYNGGPVELAGSFDFANVRGFKIVGVNGNFNKIGDNFFKDQESLEKVTLSVQVEEIGAGSFQGCTGLYEIDITTVKNIGENAFNGCNNNGFTSIVLAPTIATIGNNAFEGCSYLTLHYDGTNNLEGSTIATTVKPKVSVKFPDFASNTFGGIEVIKSGDFSAENSQTFDVEYDSLTKVLKIGSTNPEPANVLGKAFPFEKVVGFEKISFGPKVSEIATDFLTEKSTLKEIELDASVKTIGDKAFDGCTLLATITYKGKTTPAFNPAAEGSSFGVINNGNPVVINVPSDYQGEKFCGMNLNTNSITDNNGKILITFLDNVITIKGAGDMTDKTTGTSLIKEWKSATKVKIEGINKIGAFAFEGFGSLTSIVIPDSVTIIGESAFAGCVKLNIAEGEGLVIPPTVVLIDKNAFSGCKALTKVTFKVADAVHRSSLADPNGETVAKVTVKDGAFSGCILLSAITLPETGFIEIANSLLKDCAALKKLVIPADVKTIQQDAFLNSGLEYVKYMGAHDLSSFENAGIPQQAEVHVTEAYKFEKVCGHAINKAPPPVEESSSEESIVEESSSEEEVTDESTEETSNVSDSTSQEDESESGSTSDDNGNGLSGGAIAGIVIGVIAFVAAVGGLAFYFINSRKNSRVGNEE